MSSVEISEVPTCDRLHGDTTWGVLLGFLGASLAVLLAAWLGLITLSGGARPDCADFRRHGYLLVPFNHRAAGYLAEFRQKTEFKPSVHLYASPFSEAYSWSDPCDGQEVIVIGLEFINGYSDDELRGLLGHEFGHKLAARHRDPTDSASDMGQYEADGYAIELVGEPAFHAFLQRHGWNDQKARSENMERGKKALADLRKRAPLI